MASIGIGVYLISVVWLTAFMLIWISIRTGQSLGKLAIVGAGFFSVILLSLPKLDVESPSYSDKLYDKFYTSRYFTLALLILSTVVGASYSFFVVQCQPTQLRKIRSFGR